MFCRKQEWDGAWEEPGVIGTRIEIRNRKITILWRSSPVLETSFRVRKLSDGFQLQLKDTGMRYQRAPSDYARVSSIICHDDVLELTEFFPITGESKSVLRRTENSRYGNYTIADEKLTELQGCWADENQYIKLEFSGNVMKINGEKKSIHLLHSKSIDPSVQQYLIADEDPAVSGWDGISRLEYNGGALIGYVHVCDAPTVTILFGKQK